MSADRPVDVAVIGGGLAARAAALEVAGRGTSAALLLPTSFSPSSSPPHSTGRGHVLAGLPEPYPSAVARLGREPARSLWSASVQAHERLRERLRDWGNACGYEPQGGFAIARDREEAAALMEGEDLLHADGFAGEFLDHYMLETRFTVRGLAGGYWSAPEASIDDGALLTAVTAAARAAGVRVYEDRPVFALESGANGVRMETAAGPIEAGRVVLCLEDARAWPLAPWLQGALPPSTVSLVSLAIDARRRLPTPAVASGGRLAWRVQGDRLWIAAADLVVDAALEFAHAHLAVASGTADERWTAATLRPWDGVPLAGARAEARAVYYLAGFDDLGPAWSLLGARWAAGYAISGHDGALAACRAGRFT
jgi:glycine/D-amino acid oxidase-like deaminating enzyme